MDGCYDFSLKDQGENLTDLQVVTSYELGSIVKLRF